RISYRQQSAQKQIEFDDGRKQQISELRLQQYRVRERYEPRRKHTALASKLIADINNDESASLSESLSPIVSNRGVLIGQLDNEISRKMKLAINVQLNQQQLEAIHRTLRNTVREQSFWMPSNRAISQEGLLALPGLLAEQVRSLPLRQVVEELVGALI